MKRGPRAGAAGGGRTRGAASPGLGGGRGGGGRYRRARGGRRGRRLLGPLGPPGGASFFRARPRRPEAARKSTDAPFAAFFFRRPRLPRLGRRGARFFRLLFRFSRFPFPAPFRQPWTRLAPPRSSHAGSPETAPRRAPHNLPPLGVLDHDLSLLRSRLRLVKVGRDGRRQRSGSGRGDTPLPWGPTPSLGDRLVLHDHRAEVPPLR